MYVYDWSSDGKQLLVAQQEDQTHEVWLRSAAPMPNSEPARKIISNPAYHLYQPHFSPDGRWIVFEAIRSQPTLNESTLYVTPATGGPWIRITDGKLSVVDGPFVEAKEVIGGYAISELRSKEEAVALAKEFMQLHLDHMPGWEGTCEVRAFFDGAPGECS